MDKIHIGAIVNPPKQLCAWFDVQGIPSHVGYLKPRSIRDPQNAPRKDSKAFHALTLLAALKQKLQSQTDAQKGSALIHCLPDDIHQSILAKAGHGVPKGADPGQYDPVRFQYGLPVPGDHRCLSQGYQCFFYAAQIPCVIIDNPNHILKPRSL